MDNNVVTLKREQLKLTQQQAANAAGWKQPYWNRFEKQYRSGNFKLAAYRTAAIVLNCKIHELIEE